MVSYPTPRIFLSFAIRPVIAFGRREINRQISFLPAVQPQKGVGSSVEPGWVELSVLYFPSRQMTPYRSNGWRRRGPLRGLNSNQGTKSNMDMRPQDLGSVENGSPQRLLGLRQVNRFAVARDALEGDSGWASTSKSCAPRGRRSRTRATAVVDGPLDRHTLVDDALVRRADPPTKRPRKRNTVTLNSEKTRTRLNSNKGTKSFTGP